MKPRKSNLCSFSQIRLSPVIKGHISLYVKKKDGKWIFDLAGSSIVRVEETVRMAVSFYENQIPFELRDVNGIVEKIS